MKTLVKWLLLGTMIAMLFPVMPTRIHADNVINVANPGFEETTMNQATLVPINWTASLFSRTIPVDMGVTTAVANSGTKSVYISATDIGAAAWTSKAIPLDSSMQTIKTTVKVKKSSDYAGNNPWVFISYWKDGTFLNTTTAPSAALSSSTWTDITFTINSSQYPAGTNHIRLNLATSRNSTASNQGVIYYDDVKMELVPDTQAPSAPTNLLIMGQTDTSVNLSWTASTDNVGVTGYEIYNGSMLAGTVTGVTYTVSGLTANNTYSFIVKAKDAAGNVSSASNAVVINDTLAPTAPTGLVSSAIAMNNVTLNWNASTDNVGVSGYEIYNGTTLAGTVTGVTYTVSGLTANNSYTFTVKAKDAAGNRSSASNPLTVTTTTYYAVDNPGFEETTLNQAKQVPVNWASSLWSRTIPVDMGVTVAEASSGTKSVYVSATDAGAAGWTSKAILLDSSMQKIKTTVKVKKSADYAGNSPWVFISYWKDGAFLDTVTAPTVMLSSSAWTDITFTINSSQFPAGTNQIRLHLATSRGSTAVNNQGMIYYDDVAMEYVDDFSLKANTFGSWWKLGQNVVFQVIDGRLPNTVQTVSGTVYDTNNQVITQLSVDRQTLLTNGWTWLPSSEGYYEIAFDYTKQGVSGSLPLTETYKATSAKGTAEDFTRTRYAVAVTESQSKSRDDRNPMFGFSYQLEGENAIQLADLIGFDFARIHSIPWGTQFTTTSWALEPQRGVFNWTAFDQQINLLEKYEMDLVGNILYTPQWASSHPEDTSIYIAVPGYAAYAPADMNDFANFLRALVSRYGDRIKKWEVWNEPHLPGGSIFWHDTPAKFVELLRTGYETIKSVQPDSEIWIGGLGGRRYLPFYNELLRLGGASYFDKLSLHGMFPDPRDFVELDQLFNVASKPWVTSESHAGVVNASGLTVVPTELEIAKKMLLDFMFQMKHQVEQIAYFDMMNLTEVEALPFAQKEGWFTHASGLFRKTPRIEPRLGAVVMHRLMETLGNNVVYRGEYTLSNNQKAVYFENDGQPLLVVWTDDLNSGSLDSQLAGAFTAQTTVRDWTGETEIASPTLLLKPNKMYFVRNLDAAFLAGLQTTDNVLLSDYEKVKRSLDIPTANGKQGPLFDHATGVLNTDLEWMDQNWRFQSVAGPQPQGFTAKAAVGAAADGLDLVFEVTDAAFIQNETAGNYWRGDSVQFGIDTSGVGLPGGQVEFQAALTASGPVLYKSTVPYIGGDLPSNWTPSNQIVQYGSLSVDRTQADKMIYKIHIDWSELYPYVYNANKPMYLSLLVNANDGNGRIGWLEWSSGIGNAKDTGLYGKIVFDTLAPVTTATVSPAQPDDKMAGT